VSTPSDRPAFHFAPALNWMNDPNGLVWYDGEYHLFFQYNPLGSDWGNMSWGHAVSSDLWHWEELPIALRFTDTEHVFSGSVVVDHANASGLGAAGRPAMVAVYTSHAVGGKPVQAQSLAYSLDRGRTWERYAGNPVLDVGATDFRDPKVFWYDEGGHWVMVVALASDRVIQLYRSDDLLSWEHLSDFGPTGAVSHVWECPDLFPLPVDGDLSRSRWVLLVSVQGGAPAGGSGMQYFVGDFDGRTFSADVSAGAEPTWVDHGADYYAAVSFADTPDGSRLVLGWMSNWQYAHEVPAADHRGTMAVPRAYGLRDVEGGLRLVQHPVLPRRPPSYVEASRALDPGVHALPREARGRHLDIEIALDPGISDSCGLVVRQGDGEGTVVGYDATTHELFVDRTASGDVAFSPAFPAVHRAPLRLRDGEVTLRVVLDSTSVEVFGADGEVVLTDQVFPAPDSDGVALFAAGGPARLRSLRVTHLAG
jgi:fructan beta-fructosidase